jgi:hypothetical protein
LLRDSASYFTTGSRRFRLTPDEFRLINPNTLTCPVFRSERDAELTKKLYRAAPVLIAEGPPERNPWGIRSCDVPHGKRQQPCSAIPRRPAGCHCTKPR